MNKNFPFYPDISPTKEIDKKLLEKRGKYQRISDSRKQIVEYLRLKNLNKDIITGQELFKPKITKHTLANPNRSSGDYYLARAFIHKRSYSQKLTSKNSEKILNRLKYLQYTRIFQSLCSEKNALDSKTIKNSTISSKLLKILEPLTEGLEEQNISIDFRQFCFEMEALFKFLTPEEKNFIIKGEAKEKKRSKSLVLHANSRKIEFNIYERNLEKLKKTRQKIEDFRKRMYHEETSSCTFSPVIRKYSPCQPIRELWSFTQNSRLHRDSIN